MPLFGLMPQAGKEPAIAPVAVVEEPEPRTRHTREGPERQRAIAGGRARLLPTPPINLTSMDAKPICFCGQRHEPGLGLFIKIVRKKHDIDICTRDRFEIWRAEKVWAMLVAWGTSIEFDAARFGFGRRRFRSERMGGRPHQRRGCKRRRSARLRHVFRDLVWC